MGILLHGSDHVIEKPEFGVGNAKNDYGQGFYCTEDFQMAGEWACKQNKNGIINEYTFAPQGLQILDLTDKQHNILNWIALLLKNRSFKLDSEIANDTRAYLIERFSIDTSAYDVIVGYRADDSCFQYAAAFVENGLSLRGLNRAMHLGDMGLQTVLISPQAFEQIHFRQAIYADKEVYYPKFVQRDTGARETYRKEIRNSRSYRDELFALDILREEMRSDDPRIQRILFR